MRLVDTIPSILCVFGLLIFPVGAAPQSATSGALVGTITDQQHAGVAGATVELRSKDNNQTQEKTTNSAGEYAFASVVPGAYKITVTMKGFRTSTIDTFQIDVAKSYTMDFNLEIGQVSEVIQVEASARAELQTTDATLGNVLPVAELQNFPALTRQVNELLTLQPGTTPTGEVTGARNDQSTFSLDGIDVTNNSVGGLNTYAFLPIDSIEEFRVGVANPNATFGRGAGGQVSLVTRSGTAQYHGSVYWYHQNDDFNANSWDNNRLRIPRAELKDNRFGVRAGGPFPFPWHKKTYFFANYEGRRFPNTSQQSRIVPTDSLKQGVLTFNDCSKGFGPAPDFRCLGGNPTTYNLATSMLCGPNGSGACDPRSLGLSPSVSALWSKLPRGFDTSVAGSDGLNTTGFTTNAGVPRTNDFYDMRLDQDITSKWHSAISYRYFRETLISATQLNIIGGQPSTVRSLPTRQNMLVAGLNGQLTSHLSGDFRFGWVRDRDAVNPLRPNAVAVLEAIPGMNSPGGPIAIDVGAGGGTGVNRLVDEPIDVNTQVARKQSNDNRNFQWNADFIWSRGAQTWQFGTQIHFLPTLHLRDDKVIGALGALVAQLDADSGNYSIPISDRPRTCNGDPSKPGGVISTNCLSPADTQQWDRLYAGALGMVDQISVLGVRDGSFKPLPFGSQLQSDTKLWAPEFYFQDIWRLKPTFTLAVGVNYGWQTAPVERLGRQTIQVDASTGQPITAEDFLAKRAQAAANGTFFNPTFAYVPINSANRPVFDVDYGNIAPRVAFAWNPSFDSGWSGRVLGTGKTVIRGGFGIVYDRQNTVQSVIIPALGVGFAQTLLLTVPACNISGPGGSKCAPTSSDPALNIFRVGQDGTPPVPVFPTLSNPIVPKVTFNPTTGSINFPEAFSFQDDPTIKVGRNYAFDFGIQRELPGNMVVEVAYSGRFGRKLPQSMSLDQSPIYFKDPASGQTFAQAFDAVATQLRSGIAAANVTPQPWFQNLFPNAPGAPGGTIALARASASNFVNGNVSSVFRTIDQNRLLNGLPTFNNYVAQGIFLRSSTGRSNYNALLVTLNKRTSHGLTLTANYTLSKSLDQIGFIQNAANLMPNSLDLNAEYGPSAFDYRHIFNGKWVYELPFRSSNAFLKRVIQGWYTSGIFTSISGQPLVVNEGTQVWGGTLSLGTNSALVPTTSADSLGTSVHSGVTGSAGVGTGGNPATRGSGLNLFGDPASVFSKFRPVLLSQDGRSGRSNPFRGLGHWNLDASLGKSTSVTERLKMKFSADFFNIFNHVIYCDPGATNGNGVGCGGTLSLTPNQVNFGVISSQYVPANRTSGSRWIQLSLRFDF